MLRRWCRRQPPDFRYATQHCYQHAIQTKQTALRRNPQAEAEEERQMIDWYTWFLLCVLLLWSLSTPRDRNALRVVLIASLASSAIVDFITREIHAPWKLAVPGMIETLTILALLQWARNRTGYLNVGCLCIAWVAHLLCYMDVWLKTDMVYSRYEEIIMAVAVGQLLSFHDTAISMVGRGYAWAGSLWRVPAASGCSAVLSNPRR